MNYRLLFSDFTDELRYDEELDEISTAEATTNGITWNVVHDTLRSGKNGWQVFNFVPAVKMRYVRIHFLSNTDKTHCGLVQLEVYSKKLIGYDHNFLPTLIEDLSRASAIHTKMSNVEQGNSINKLLRKLLEKLNTRIHDSKKDGMHTVARHISLLTSDIKSIVHEIDLYEVKINDIKEKIYSGTNKILKHSTIIKIVSISLGIIGLLIELLKSLL